MPILKQERVLLEEFFPGLDEALAAVPLMDLEKPGSLAIPLYRNAGGPALLIPKEFRGLGASPLQAVRIQRAIASRAPSLAVATTMHHYSIVTYLELLADRPVREPEKLLLEDIAQRNLYVASGFAEGQTNTGVLLSTLKVTRADGGLVVSGSKKPCSLSASMDVLCASLLLPEESGEARELVLVTIPSDTPGIKRRPFWNNPILAGAESDEIVLENVFVPESNISYVGVPTYLDKTQARCLIWFELLVSAAYLGIATALVERTITEAKGVASERALLCIEVEGAMAALEAVARAMDGPQTEEEMVRALFVRYAVQRAIERATTLALELQGGMSFVKSPEGAYLYAAARALAFHPPSRLSISETLDKYMAGEAFARLNW